MSIRTLSGSFTGTGQSAAVVVSGGFNFEITGFGTASVTLQRRVDGTNWVNVSKNADGDAATYTAAVSLSGYEPMKNVSYRFNCTSHSDGTIAYLLKY